jgi:general secretion pathway protein D
MRKMIKYIKLAALWLSLIVCASCQHSVSPVQDKVLLNMTNAAPVSTDSSPDPLLVDKGIGKTEALDSKPFVSLAPYGDRQARKKSDMLTDVPFSPNKLVTVVIDDMPITEFIHQIFTGILGVNYVLDSKIEDLKRNVTLKLEKKVSEYQMFEVVRGVLAQNEIIVYYKDNIFYLTQGDKDKRITVGIGASMDDIPVVSGQIQQVIPVKYADVQNLFGMLTRSQGVTIIPDLRENVYIVTGSREQVEQAMQMINLLDRPAMRGRFVGMQQVTYWNPVDMAAKLNEIMAQESIPVTKDPTTKGVQINVLEQRGLLIFFAAEKEWLERIKFWIRTLDTPLASEEKQFFFYFPQNCLAVELGDSLDNIIGVSQTSKKAKKESSRKSSGTSKMSASRTGDAAQKAVKTPDEKVASTKTSEPGDGSENFIQDVFATVDEGKNALIIYATQQKYKVVETLLKRLDIMPIQVLLEATIAEITLKDDLKYGLEWFLNSTRYLNSVGGTITGNMGTLGKLGLGGNIFNYSYISEGLLYQTLINALAQNNLIKILSSPRVTVRDGKTASLVVGKEVPIVTNENTSQVITGGNSGIIRAIQYRKTGVSIEVTPMVQAKNVVTLEINQEVSEAQTNTTSDINSPMILNRTINTEVVASDGQTVLLGGLIQEKNSNTINKIPLLGDIPYLGYMFKTTSDSQERTELVLMITPRIIRNTQQIDEMRDAIFGDFHNIGVK